MGQPVRGTQTFVHTLAACWRRPSLTALEVLWRWSYGVPAMAVVAYEAMRVAQGTQLDRAGLERMTWVAPMAAVETLGQAAVQLLPPLVKIGVWLGPLLALAWVVTSSIGRGVVLRRVDASLHVRTGTLMVLQAVRMAALGAAFGAWFVCLRGAAQVALDGPMAAGQDPNLVLYCAFAIVATLGLFTAWAVVSWGLSIAPLLAMRLDLGAGASLSRSFRMGALRGRLVEINLVLGIVKIALIVLAMVLSACPLPFESVATPGFMLWWYGVVSVLYLVASDFFHVAQLVGYLELWKAHDAGR